jgi:hypothetical protein
MPTDASDLAGLTLLGGQAQPSKNLEAFPNRSPGRFYRVVLETDEFTCLCPKTGQPDFATIRVEYVPDEKVVESKSFKLYLWSYRNEAPSTSTWSTAFWRPGGVLNRTGACGASSASRRHHIIEAEHTRTPEAAQWHENS